jgi:hypothetical protein
VIVLGLKLLSLLVEIKAATIPFKVVINTSYMEAKERVMGTFEGEKRVNC